MGFLPETSPIGQVREKLKDYLAPEQYERLPTLEWLLDEIDYRQTGRTTTIAAALILIALSHPGKNVNFVDHIEPNAGKDLIGREVMNLAERLGLRFVYDRYKFRYDG